jgi:polysaccharide chain length determinant protein (PEP-CTERM system associated)
MVAIAGWGAIYTIPDVYQASARVAVDTNSLLPDLTEGLTARESVINEVQLVREALLARPNLEAVARETALDRRARTEADFEELITRLQDDIWIRGGGDNIFDIAFSDTNREKAIEVVAGLVDTFVASSLGAQGDDSDVTERALRSELEDHEQRLSEAETDLAEFKKRNLGYMPEDGSDYYTRLQAALAQVNETERALKGLHLRRDEIARQLEGEEPVFGIMPSTPAQASATCSKSASLAQLRDQLAALRVEFTDKHPRIVMLKESIAVFEQECADELAASGGFAPVFDSKTQSLNANPVYQNLRLQLSNSDVEIAALREELESKRRLVSQLRSDVDKIAMVETQLKRLNRDYDVVSSRYQELLRRWETLQSSKRTGGAQPTNTSGRRICCRVGCRWRICLRPQSA